MPLLLVGRITVIYYYQAVFKNTAAIVLTGTRMIHSLDTSLGTHVQLLINVNIYSASHMVGTVHLGVNTSSR